MTENRTLEVYYHEKKVGTLAETRDKRVAFQYSDDWIKTGFSISPCTGKFNYYKNENIT